MDATYEMKRANSSIENDWVYHDDILINVDPIDKVTRGYYVEIQGLNLPDVRL